MSIRWKIAALCIALALLPILFLNRYTVQVFDAFTRGMLEDQMVDYAHVIGEEYRLQLEHPETDEAFTGRLRSYQERFGARLQLVDASGVVQFDSDADPDVGTCIAGLREVERALAGRYGARNALTPDRSLMYYYIALPIRNADGAVIAAARVSAHTQAITRQIQRIVTDYRVTMAITLGAAVLAAILFSFTMTRRLRSLTRAVKSFARGESLMHIRTAGRDEIGELSRAVEQMALEIHQIQERQGGRLASTTHELKTPLTAIKGAVQMLRDEGAAHDPAALRRFLSNIDISSDRLLRMVEQLAALSKLEAEELRGRKERVAYASFVRETVARLYPSSPVPIVLDLPEGDPDVPIIPERIEQVLANMLENALRYTPAEGLITVSVRVGKSELVTEVKDTGTGIEPSDLPKVFQQFFTTVPKNSLREYGSGLGLAIAQSIIQNHGGTIGVASEPGKGSVFTFTLPM